MFGSTVWFSRSADRTVSGFLKSKMAAGQDSDISAADHPIYSVFGSRMGFSGSAYQMTLFPV